MCFSATASFTASAVLLMCGITALIRAKKKQQFFAMIPLLFSVQQFIEGTIWQSLASGNAASSSVYAYLTFVYVVWPIWLPFSILIMTEKRKERMNLALPLMAGIVIAICAVAFLIAYPTQAYSAGNHIRYHSDVPQWLWLPGSALYLFATVAPFLLSSIPNMWPMGILLALSYGATLLFYKIAIISVWCFFVALLSVFIFLIIG